jgi:hypothetical protein
MAKGGDILGKIRKLMSRSRKRPLGPLPKPPRKPPRRGGSEPVMAEPGRPKLGEGGAAAELEFDD